MAPQRKGVAAAASGSGGAGSGTGGGARLGEELVGEAEEQLERLEKSVGAKQASAHLGPAPAGVEQGEEATVLYFAYGSNINRKVFEGRRMIKPAESLPAVLPGWQLTFSQPGLPYFEPAFAAVERQPEALTAAAEANGRPGSSSSRVATPSGRPAQPDVHGVVHRITPSQWQYVLQTEGAAVQNEDSGYKVVEATAVTYNGRELPGVLTLSVTPNIKRRLAGRDALPSLRYITLIREGAADYGLKPEYQAWLQTLGHYQAEQFGQKVGKAVFSGIAFTTVFPAFAAARVLRKVTGTTAGGNNKSTRALAKYTGTVFSVVHGLHELLRPVLGCGTTAGSGGGVTGTGGSQR